VITKRSYTELIPKTCTPKPAEHRTTHYLKNSTIFDQIQSATACTANSHCRQQYHSSLGFLTVLISVDITLIFPHRTPKKLLRLPQQDVFADWMLFLITNSNGQGPNNMIVTYNVVVEFTTWQYRSTDLAQRYRRAAISWFWKWSVTHVYKVLGQ